MSQPYVKLNLYGKRPALVVMDLSPLEGSELSVCVGCQVERENPESFLVALNWCAGGCTLLITNIHMHRVHLGVLFEIRVLNHKISRVVILFKLQSLRGQRLRFRVLSL